MNWTLVLSFAVEIGVCVNRLTIVGSGDSKLPSAEPPILYCYRNLYIYIWYHSVSKQSVGPR